MKVLIIGSGGREHALAWKISQSPNVQKIYSLPGNAGTENLGENISLEINDFDAIGRFIKEKKVDLTVVGPEIPLVNGFVDYFQKTKLTEKGHLIFGPNQKAAQLEGSKIFAKKLMEKYHIPTAPANFFSQEKEALKYLEKNFEASSLVIKADGLASGKGVILPKTLSQAKEAVKKIMKEKIFGRAGEQIIIEKKLFGEEASILALTDGKTIKTLVSSQDHKAIYDGDEGPNTGGMGAYAPTPLINQKLEEKIEETILKPTLKALTQEGIFYQGCLYVGLMIDKNNEPFVIEFNCRFGDPETQVVLMMLESDLVELLLACIGGQLGQKKIKNKKGAACCVVMASGGYPNDYQKGKIISGLENVPEDVYIFHAGTTQKNNQIITNGGRVLGVTGYGRDIKEATQTAYQGVAVIHWKNEYHRQDIGWRALKN